MCGIAGFLGVGLDVGRHDTVLEAMMGMILHRGPDEQGYLVDGRAALGNVRLSIVDLAHGSQPIATPDERYWIVFNGEVFNFKELRLELQAQGADFRTHCDTEVVLWGLALEGAAFLGRMNGQYAFCFYDRRTGTSILARDRLGERPLYYTAFDGGLVFASEVKGIAAYPGFRCEIDPVAVNDTLIGWSAMPGASAFKGVHALEPGCYGVFANGRFETARYDTVTAAAALEPESSLSFEAACAEMRAALTHSVQIRLRADLEVGAYVSGGLDSTITARLAQKELDTQLRTFSIRFADKGFDEGAYQSTVQQQLGSDHSEITVSPADYLSAFSDVVYHAELPMYRLAPIPMYLLAGLVHDSGLKVVLTGEGSDEFFLGYDLYRELGTRLAIEDKGLDQATVSAKVQQLYPYLDHFRDDKVAGVVRFFETIAGNTDDPLYGHRPRHAVGKFGTRLLRRGQMDGVAPYGERLLAKVRERHPGFDRLEPLEKTMVVESETLLAGYLLCSQGDRMSAAHAVEARYPFIDHTVVAAALKLPVDYRLKGGEREKHILKEAFGDIVPDSVINRPKYPYRAPDGELMLDPAFARFLPQRDDLEAAGLFDPDLALRFVGRLKPETMGQRELQALTVLVSTQMLYRTFSAGGLPAPKKLNNLTVRVDMRGAA